MKAEYIGLIAVAAVLVGGLGFAHVMDTYGTISYEPINPNGAQTKAIVIPETIIEPEKLEEIVVLPTEPYCVKELTVTLIVDGEVFYQGELTCHGIENYKHHPLFTVVYENGFTV